MARPLDFRLLGPLEVRDGDRTLSLGGRKQRTLLAILLLHANEVVSTDTLIDGLWGEQAPKTAGTALQVYVSNLRKLLSPERLETRTPGYLLHVEPEELDLACFERLASETNGGDANAAAATLDEALSLWRGDPLADFAYDPFAQGDIARLEELHLNVIEQRIDAELQLGRHANVVGELQALVAKHPFREHLRRQLMLALYRSGRQTEALEAYQQARGTLVDELGIEPSAQLREVEQAILRQDDSLRPPRPVSRPSEEQRPEQLISGPSDARVEPARRAGRKTVTVLFCDLVESTQPSERLDPEARTNVMARCHEVVQAALERHGGTVKKVVGDVVMAVFGVPLTHEDDALRAVRAAAEVRVALATVNSELERDYGVQIDSRIGINTGEAVVGEGENLVAGAAVNLAASLEHEAKRGDILLGEDTHRLVRDVVLAATPEQGHLKGENDSVPARRLLAVLPDLSSFARPLATPFVGREHELAVLRTTFDRAVAKRRCELVTVLGPPGIGKSRLIREFAASVRHEARVLAGRCLPYGDGITYWPLVEVMKDVAPKAPRDVICTLLGDDESAERVAELVAAAIGESDRAGSTEQTHWAVRKLFEAFAHERPLIVVFEDLHWAEPTFLDLIEYIDGLSAEAPIMFLASARPELLETRAEWAAPGPREVVHLERLPAGDVDALIDALLETRALAERLRAPTIEASDGNPLFIEQLLAMETEEAGEVVVPPTLQALLASRVDRLDPGDRAVLQRASVEGRSFHREAVAILLPEDDRDDVSARLLTLTHHELIRPNRSQFHGDEDYRFVHVLLRDAAYDSMSKELRAELHARHADWLERATGDGPADYEEIRGYHLEQAFRYRLELGPADERTRGLALRAAELLATAGARALGRNDVGASLNLLQRALALKPDDDPAVALRIDLSQTLLLSGEFGSAGELAEEAATRAAAAGDGAGEFRARLARARIAAQVPRKDAGEEPNAELLPLAELARPVFARARDEVGLTDAWVATAWAELARCRWAAMLDAVEHALEHAHRAGYVRWERELPVWKGTALFYGPTPLEEVFDWYEEEQPQHPMAFNERAVLEAMRRRFDEARELLATADATAAEFGETLWRACGGMAAWEVETLAGDDDAAERAARSACEQLEQLGDTGFRPLAAGQLAASLYTLGRLDEADRWVDTAEELAGSDDVVSQMLLRQVRAKLLARGGHYAQAERLAREAIDISGKTDMLNWHANALMDLAEVYVLAARSDEGRAQLEQALALYERKGNLISAERARAALTQMREKRSLATQPKRR